MPSGVVCPRRHPATQDQTASPRGRRQVSAERGPTDNTAMSVQSIACIGLNSHCCASGGSELLCDATGPFPFFQRGSSAPPPPCQEHLGSRLQVVVRCSDPRRWSLPTYPQGYLGRQPARRLSHKNRLSVICCATGRPRSSPALTSTAQRGYRVHTTDPQSHIRFR